MNTKKPFKLNSKVQEEIANSLDLLYGKLATKYGSAEIIAEWLTELKQYFIDLKDAADFLGIAIEEEKHSIIEEAEYPDYENDLSEEERKLLN